MRRSGRKANSDLGDIVNREDAKQRQAGGKHAALTFFWAILGALSTVAVFPYVLAITESAIRPPVPLWVVVIAQAGQIAVLTFFLGWLGLRLGESVGLDSPVARALVYGIKPVNISCRALTDSPTSRRRYGRSHAHFGPTVSTSNAAASASYSEH